MALYNPASCSCAKVYVATVPLRVPPGPPSWLINTVEASGITKLCHYMTIVQSKQQCTVFDFQPENPEDPLVALALICGQQVSGIVQQRRLPRLPSSRIELVGNMLPGLDLTSAVEFNNSWPTDLILHRHDCRHHTAGLVGHLTGRMVVPF
ncbi:hypothetical protein SELMODRAFT_94653 [Selaginella moellendorffii]|uniref:Uncharacterized protein n=1 Tax=Selaginella moellendorffii TaxID=88036 RepID=D8RJG2_SELML|nr:hypothetical protein SELMODRAFT_94653 [Selaginella moellendorffii]